jgi:hypothetical protein
MNLVLEGDVSHRLKLQRCVVMHGRFCAFAACCMHLCEIRFADAEQVIAETQDDWAELAHGKIPAKDYWVGSK